MVKTNYYAPFLFTSQVCHYHYLHKPASLKTHVQLCLAIIILIKQSSCSRCRNRPNEWLQATKCETPAYNYNPWWCQSANIHLNLHRPTDIRWVLYIMLAFHGNTNTWVMRFNLRLVHLVSYSGRSCSCCCSSSKSTRSHSYSSRACRLFHNSRNNVTAENECPKCNYASNGVAEDVPNTVGEYEQMKRS